MRNVVKVIVTGGRGYIGSVLIDVLSWPVNQTRWSIEASYCIRSS